MSQRVGKMTISRDSFSGTVNIDSFVDRWWLRRERSTRWSVLAVYVIVLTDALWDLLAWIVRWWR